MPDPVDIKSVVHEQGLVTDLNSSMSPSKVWTYARNAVLNSHNGDVRLLQTEPSTVLCVDLPMTPIGFIRLLDSRWAVFMTDEVTSEIGIFDEGKCTYKKVVSSNCLGFSINYPIKGISKESPDCGEVIYWTDRKNPRRYLKIGQVPYKFSTRDDDSCKTKEFTDELDCSRLLVDKNISVPHLSTSISSGGSLKNGVYEFAIAYSLEGQRVTDYYGITVPERIWSHENFGQSIDIEITNLDIDFDEYEIIAISTEKQVTRYKSLGYYPINVTHHNISSVDRPEYTEISLQEILVPRPKYTYADDVTSNDSYALWSGVTTTPELNYQLQAMDIKSLYTVVFYPQDYYAKGGKDIGLLRDEVYAFGIQWLLLDGSWSSVFHIPGPKLAPKNSGLASGPNVYEADLFKDLEVKNWQVFNTAGTAVRQKVGTLEGEMGVYLSDELYPDNKIMFGESSCTPIRHHRMPDNTITHIYSDAGNTINILGVKFTNIEHPKDSSGKYIEGINTYRIVRGDRKGNNSIIAKGVLTNIRSYTENNQEVLYSNYPYNSLSPDPFLSSKQPYYNSGEKDFSPLSSYKEDQFSFYAPHSLFGQASLGEEIHFYTEEISQISGAFEEVYKHPRAKLLTQFDLYFALIIGALDGYYATTGQRGKEITITQNHTIGLGSIQTPAGPTPPQTIIINRTKQERAINNALEFASASNADRLSLNFAERVIKALASAGVFVYFAMQTAQKVLDIIAEASPWKQYALQHNSHGLFNNHKNVPIDHRRRYLSHYQYIYDGLNTIQDKILNNYKRENSVYLQIQKPVNPSSTTDTSLKSLSESGLCSNIQGSTSSTASIFYGANKRRIRSQYGQLQNISYLDTGYIVSSLENKAATGSKDRVYETEQIFGGDTFISRFAIKRSQQYFSTFLHDVPDGYTVDYRNYRNLAYPRFWIDTSKYDLSDVVSLSPKKSRTPRNKHNLDCGGNVDLKSVTVVKDAYFFISNNSVLDFFIESDYNLDYRDWSGPSPTFYSRSNSSLTNLFRSDKIEQREEFSYDRTYSKQLTENYMAQQRVDYDPQIDLTCYQYLKNRVIYSLPSQEARKGDNWLVYLSLNKYDFPMAEFGSLTGMHPIDNQQIMFLFDKSAPYVTIGRDELALDGSGTKITIGDAGLFARPPKPIAFTDFHYGNSQSRWAFANTQFGSIYPSQRQGRIFIWRGQFEEISDAGMHYWFKNFLPSQLDIPDYPHIDKPTLGTAVLSGFDPTTETYYLSKRDYRILPEYKGRVMYDKLQDALLLDSSRKVSLKDTGVFEDVSWTISYNPRFKMFISWHDWKPDWMLQSENHFISIKSTGVYKHNQICSSFCNYYGVNYPFELEFLVQNGPDVEVLKSLEYMMDAGKYFSDCRQFHTILDHNFDHLVVYNSEQCSGYLTMYLQNKNDMTQLTGYPRYDVKTDTIQVLYTKEEQKYRVNQFSDIVKDRGEFTHRNYPIWLPNADGYTKTLNSQALDYQKPVQLRKKLRDTYHKALLSKSNVGDKKIIMKILSGKQNASPR